MKEDDPLTPSSTIEITIIKIGGGQNLYLFRYSNACSTANRACDGRWWVFDQSDDKLHSQDNQRCKKKGPSAESSRTSTSGGGNDTINGLPARLDGMPTVGVTSQRNQPTVLMWCSGTEWWTHAPQGLWHGTEPRMRSDHESHSCSGPKRWYR
jgi:hypothetical protein